MGLPHVGEWLVVPQKRLRTAGLMALLAASSFMTPLSLDMYTPAVPYMAGYFSTTPDMVNLTLSGFFVCFTLGMLVFGPVSDRFGRRPAFVASYMLYAVGSLVCALAPIIEIFVFARVLQGLGAGGASSVSMAVVKDAFDAEHRGSVLGIMQVLFVIGPVVAPLLGAAIISTLGWRASFWALTVVGAAALAASFLFEETIPDEGRVKGGVGVVAGRLAAVARNKGFMLFLVATSCLELSFMAYVAVASYVYMGTFGLGEMGYSLCFSAAALRGHCRAGAVRGHLQAHGRAAVHHGCLGAGAGGRRAAVHGGPLGISGVLFGEHGGAHHAGLRAPVRHQHPAGTAEKRHGFRVRAHQLRERRHRLHRACSCRFCPGRTT